MLKQVTKNPSGFADLFEFGLSNAYQHCLNFFKLAVMNKTACGRILNCNEAFLCRTKRGQATSYSNICCKTPHQPWMQQCCRGDSLMNLGESSWEEVKLGSGAVSFHTPGNQRYDPPMTLNEDRVEAEVGETELT